MISPKTNWTETDYFNVEDYNRIAANLNELLPGYPPPPQFGDVTPVPAATVGESLTLDNRVSFARAFNGIMASAGWELSVSTAIKYWFDWRELNTIESAILALNQSEGKAEYSAGLVYDTGAVYGGGAHG